MITAGRLGDQRGRRRMFSLGMALFTIASPACGAAASPAVLVLARVAQGVGAALLAPQVLSTIGVSMPAPTALARWAPTGRRMSWPPPAASSSEACSYRPTSWVSAGAAASSSTSPSASPPPPSSPNLVPESRARRPSRLDVVGTVLVTLGLTAIILPLVEGRQHGWPTPSTSRPRSPPRRSPLATVAG